MSLAAELESTVAAALESAGAPPGTPAVIGPSRRPELGDYQANGAMAAAAAAGVKPRELAERAAVLIREAEMVESVRVDGPGFINITLSSGRLERRLEAALGSDRLGPPPPERPLTVVVDYSHPNLAKEMHVGHLRSTIIGDSLVRILEHLGHRVVRHNHVGDWGTQFGMLIAYLDRGGGGGDAGHALSDLEEFYRAAKRLFDSDQDFARSARDYVVRLQSGDPHCLRIWRRFIDESLRHCEEVYRALGVTLTPGDVKPESFYNPELPAVIEALEEKGLVTESEGALCVFLDEFAGKDGKPVPAIVRKSDGGYLYATTDLAAVRHRALDLGADRIVYVVDARQTLHLSQVFAVARAAGFAPPSCSLEHHAFGTMMGEDGRPFKTREGGTVKLTALIDEARERAYRLVSGKNPDLAEERRRRIAEAVGIGALKYADLSQNRTSDYVFSWEKMLSLEGNTAPYMQYAYARIKSIFRRGRIREEEAEKGRISLREPKERSLALALERFGGVLEQAAKDGFPNSLCSYLYDLAGEFMSFYESCPVLKAGEPDRSSRLALCLLTARTVKTGLALLGIETVDRM
ncbi:MAG TPA: arginine--tRNA ligase [bacterium]|nr:arginine--tRNA ligase [bacterium]HPQ66988.1 arginine--tRNA ligase [bacterium]